MPQSPHHLRNDLKCVEWDVKPYYTIAIRTLLFKVGASHDEAGVTAVRKLIRFCQQILRLFAFEERVGATLRYRQYQYRHRR